MSRPSPEPAHGPPLPAHLQPRLVALVALGGAAGSLARYGVGEAVGERGGIPLGTLGVNVVGAFLLGLLVEGLARRGPDRGRRRAARLLLGTGFLGGFTTYSAFALESERLASGGEPAIALAYVLATLGLGYVASIGGVLVARRLRIRRRTGGAR